jgi:RimJ/RimL family protein N-acetyltransferase
VRSFRTSDAADIARAADNRKIWRNLKDQFPHPYAIEHAEAFIAYCQAADPESAFAIEVDGRAVGVVGFERRADIWRRSVEIGYWLAEDCWGRGVASEVVRAITAWAFDTWDINRIWAGVFDWNTASARALEKAGYVLEGRLRHSAIKDGTPVDELIYAVVRE